MGSIRRAMLGTGLLLATVLASAGEPAAATPVKLDIKSQPMADALNQWAQETGLQVIFPEESATAKLVAPEVKGRYVPAVALTKLLENSGLRFEYLNERTVAVKVAQAPQVNSSSDQDKENARRLGVERAQSESPRTGEPSDQSETGGSQGANQKSPEKLEEIVVSAQKKLERLQDVPVPVAVLNTETLTQTNQLRIEDYFSKVPGLNVQTSGDSQSPSFSIRGIVPGSGAPTVGVMIDDVPYGSTTGIGGIGQPNIDPGDLARVEVLRGPQGTLYGANSMGGLIKFVTIDPSTDRLSGDMQVGTSDISHGTGDGYNLRGSINVPVNDTTAFRASAFRDQEPGYIDNIQSERAGVNRRTSEGGRFSMQWKPSDILSLKVGTLLQDLKRDGAAASVVGPGFADLQVRVTPNTFTTDQKTRAYSFAVNAKFGGVELVSLTGYNVDDFHLNDDLARTSGGYFTDCGGTPIPPGSPGGPCGLSEDYLGVGGSVELSTIRAKRFSQELRLSVPIGDRITWLLGGFYTNERDELLTDFDGADPVTGVPAGESLLSLDQTNKYIEYAAFTNLQYNITDRFDVQLGGRWSKNTQTFATAWYGLAAEATVCPGSVPAGTQCPTTILRANDTPLTYLFTPRYKISPNLMVYARFASGYKPGGPNPGFPGTPTQFYAEKTKNYELGLKGDFLDHIFTVDASLYYIDWSDIVVGASVLGTPLGYEINAGRAKSQGAELAAEARPLKGLTVSAWVVWADAEFKSGFPEGAAFPVILPGDRLPYTSRFSGSLAVDDNFVVSSPLMAFVGGSLSYVGDRLGGAQYTGTPRAHLPAYAQMDLHAGLKYQTWTITAFVKNVTDKRGVLDGGVDYQYIFPDPNTYTFIQPRTVGLNLAKTF